MAYAWLIVTYIDKNGRRVTTESSYLTANVLRRPNLTVVVGARATRILIDSAPGIIYIQL
jgi:choline dehydrogenase